jgi:Flp pilus assembly protein TadD
MDRSIFSRLVLIGLASATLAACASASTPQDGPGVYGDKIDAALERAAGDASRKGSAQGSLAFLEKLYKRDPQNADNALKFARALRQAGELQKSQLVLEPLARAANAPAAVLAEYGSLLINLAQYPEAEAIARKAIAQDAGAFGAYQVLGIALDAQSQYEDAEKAFRQALELWQGDPIPVMNNLALNLTNQERLPEALEIMEKAKAAAPNRVEVERNLRIIRTLNETASGRPAPRPAEKPRARAVSTDDAAPTKVDAKPDASAKPDVVHKEPLKDDAIKKDAATKDVVKDVVKDKVAPPADAATKKAEPPLVTSEPKKTDEPKKSDAPPAKDATKPKE